MKELHACPNRSSAEQDLHGATGIYCRAKSVDGKWGSFDIAELTRESLLIFLRSRGGDNPWAEDCVGILLGHGHLHKLKDSPDEQR